LKEEEVLRFLLAVALASAVLVPLSSAYATQSESTNKPEKTTKPQKQKTASADKQTPAKAVKQTPATAVKQKPTSTPTTNTATTKSRQGNDRKVSTKAEPPRKAQDETVTPNRGTIDSIGTVGRGQTVEVHATALRSGQMCALQIFYDDKPAKTIRDVEPDAKKRCTFTVTVPDRPSAVGLAKAKLILTNASSGKPSGEAKQTFTVT